MGALAVAGGLLGLAACGGAEPSSSPEARYPVRVVERLPTPTPVVPAFRVGSMDGTRGPALGQVQDFTATAGNVWVQRRDADGLRVDGFTPEGEVLRSFVAEVRLSGRAPPVVSHGWLLGLEEDSLDVPYVVGFRIAAAPAGG